MPRFVDRSSFEHKKACFYEIFNQRQVFEFDTEYDLNQFRVSFSQFKKRLKKTIESLPKGGFYRTRLEADLLKFEHVFTKSKQINNKFYCYMDILKRGDE